MWMGLGAIDKICFSHNFKDLRIKLMYVYAISITEIVTDPMLDTNYDDRRWK